MTTDTHFRPVTARLPADVYEKLRTLAEQEQRSVSNMLRLIASQYLDGHHDATDLEQAQAETAPDELRVSAAETPSPET